MANNRLYIGNMERKEYLLVAKGWGGFWDKDWFDAEKIEELITNSLEGGVGQKTSLVFFTEYDDCYDDFAKYGTKI